MRTNLSRCFSLAFTVALIGLMQVGCKSTKEATTQPEMAQVSTQPEMAPVSPGALALCTSCGQFKGTAVCCQADQALCAACGLAKGSPGCCRIAKDSAEPVAVCLACGHIKGDALCCQPGQLRCESCGLVKGSAGCCKIPRLAPIARRH
ncbi:MAG: hypothetical protein V3T84_17925 [Phycisphaerales bacterium]